MFNIIFKIERWKFNSDYGVWVSTEGRIKNINKNIVPPKVGDDGYLRSKIITGKYTSTHKLVMETWKPLNHNNNKKEMSVDHLDHNKRNNALSNLEWVTKKENRSRGARDHLLTDNKKFQGMFV